MKRKTFTFYSDWKEILKFYPNDLKVELYEAIVEYASTGILPNLSKEASLIFPFLKKYLDEDLCSYQAIVQRNKENGKKGGRKPKKTQKTQVNPENPVGLSETQKTQRNPNKPNETQITHKTQVVFEEEKERSKEKEEYNKKEVVITTSKKDESEVNESLINFGNEIMQMQNQNWREVMSKKFKIVDFEKATEDYKDWLIGTTLCFQANTLEDYKRIFCYNASKFLSDKALFNKPNEPLVINGVEYS